MTHAKTCFVLLFFLSMLGCTQKQVEQPVTSASNKNFLRWNKVLTDVIVQDLFNPPQATRIYAYCNIAAYEALVPAAPGYTSFAGQLNALTSLPAPDKNKNINYEIAAMSAFNTVAAKYVYTAFAIADFQKQQVDSFVRNGWGNDVVKNSVEFGKAIGDSVYAWSATDGFRESRGKTRYALKEATGSWKPTPPDYMPAAEPYWGTIRTFTFMEKNQGDTATNFYSDTTVLCAEDPPLFSYEKSSPYFKWVNEVYEIVNNLTEEQKIIASFWDDNPNVSTYSGHFMYFSQKMTPGGHWLAITAKASEMKNLSLIETAEAFALTSIAMSDAFKCCWKEKYRFNTIRPVTVINEKLNAGWNPYIQTPPFPEYPSGHSTVSASAAEVLTKLFGEGFAFTDSSEYEYELPVRSFKSFREAAAEAKMSRLYGGIHFGFGNEAGAVLGKKIGGHICTNIITRKKT